MTVKEREKNEQFAIDHTALMFNTYEKRIQNSYERTIKYGVGCVTPLYVGYPKDLEKVKIEVYPEDIVTAIFDRSEGNTAILESASYKSPGGGFMRGRLNEEESICRASNLYNVISKFDEDFYRWNNDHLEYGYYCNRALFVPDIVFGLEGHMPTRCSVIVCAPPNVAAASAAAKARHFKFKLVDNRRALYERIRFAKLIAEENKIETLIVGPYGCGDNGQNPREVADFFADVFKNTVVKRLIFAISREDERNYTAFAERLS